ncbi:hypothetical protein GRI75_09535 [Altererythrobacter soli]|uniref:Predicted 3'-5' exonuclease PolB-like domain-containing protein n=1 Tax=Croceibacterium soli TaxID=1739690 RepID=A0A6I4USJ5_9SPHN|nr:ribonuclease H-like domain-containing protein [Croceibacterium soli]MXP41882.1 hypothetical protein [Croceibacterium soli]
MRTVVLDVETIADSAAMERCGYQEEPGVFAPWPLHRLACASTLTIDRVDLNDLAFNLHSYSLLQMTERGIIASVERAVEQADQVLTYNGRAFDIPVLLARAAIAEEYVPTLARLGHQCRPGLHQDLHQQIKGSGAGIKLAHLCAAFSIPAKSGGAGNSVASLAAEGRWRDIEHYCETDVVATWLAAQMWDSCEHPGFGRGRWELLSRWLTPHTRDNPSLAAFCELPTFTTAPPPSIEVTF